MGKKHLKSLPWGRRGSFQLECWARSSLPWLCLPLNLAALPPWQVKESFLWLYSPFCHGFLLLVMSSWPQLHNQQVAHNLWRGYHAQSNFQSKEVTTQQQKVYKHNPMRGGSDFDQVAGGNCIQAVILWWLLSPTFSHLGSKCHLRLMKGLFNMAVIGPTILGLVQLSPVKSL